MNSEKYSGIWIFAEQSGGVIHPAVFELLAKAQQLKAHSGEIITAVLLGSNVRQLADELIARGAEQVIVAEAPSLEMYSARRWHSWRRNTSPPFCFTAQPASDGIWRPA